MFRTSLITVICALSATLAIAQDAQYQTWMRSIGTIVGNLTAGLNAKDTTITAAEATKLAAMFEQIDTYWKNKHTDDAERFAAAAIENCKAIAASKTFEEQNAAWGKVQVQCSGCHKAHRDGFPGSFTMK